MTNKFLSLTSMIRDMEKLQKKRKRRKDYSLTIENMKGCNEKRKGEKKNG